MDHGNQKFVIDEITENPDYLVKVEINYPYDVTVYMNGLELSQGNRVNRFSLKEIRTPRSYGMPAMAKKVALVLLMFVLSFATNAAPQGIFDFLKKERTGREHVAQQGKNKFKGYNNMKFTKSQLSGITYKKGGRR